MATPDRASPSALRSRVLALEQRTHPINSTENEQRFSAAVRALFDALEASWPDGRRPPINTGGHCPYASAALAWLQRVEAGTETDADRRAAAGIPPCHVTVHELLRACGEAFSLTDPEVDALLELEYGPHRARAPALR